MAKRTATDVALDMGVRPSRKLGIGTELTTGGLWLGGLQDPILLPHDHLQMFFISGPRGVLLADANIVSAKNPIMRTSFLSPARLVLTDEVRDELKDTRSFIEDEQIQSALSDGRIRAYESTRASDAGAGTYAFSDHTMLTGLTHWQVYEDACRHAGHVADRANWAVEDLHRVVGPIHRGDA